jgi:perosamine synthetase
MVPYSRQSINQDDIEAVVAALKSDYLTGGQRIEHFERKFAEKVGARYAVAVSSGTAALHASMFAVGIEPGDEVIVPAMTFMATANAVVYQGGTPVFADVDADTLLIDVKDVERKLTNKTKAIMSVDYAGQHTDIPAFGKIRVSDSCHSLIHHGAMSCHSFHPVKNMTTGEGGMVVFNQARIGVKARRFRNHGRIRHEQVDLGYNYRLTDIQAALGISQLDRLDQFMARRREIAKIYDGAFVGTDIRPLGKVSNHSYHLYVIKVPNRDEFRQKLAARGIGTQVHYRPVNLEPYYNQPGTCPVAEKEWQNIVSIPMYPDLTDSQVEYIIKTAKESVYGNTTNYITSSVS